MTNKILGELLNKFSISKESLHLIAKSCDLNKVEDIYIKNTSIKTLEDGLSKIDIQFGIVFKNGIEKDFYINRYTTGYGKTL